MSEQYQRLEDGPIDEIDAAIWSGDTFHDATARKKFRDMMKRWEKGLQEAEEIGVGDD